MSKDILGSNSARIYTAVQDDADPTHTPNSAIGAAHEMNLSILIGLWIDGNNPSAIENQLDALNQAIKQFKETQVDTWWAGIAVGNENLYANSPNGRANQAPAPADPETIVMSINKTRGVLEKNGLSGIPVGHVDTWDQWKDSSAAPVIDASDFIGMNAFPYWQANDHNNNTIGNSLNVFNTSISEVLGRANGKQVWVTETGWPTSGAKHGDAEASFDNAQTYWDQVGCALADNFNMWWYTLADADPANVQLKWSVGNVNSNQAQQQPTVKMTCPC